MCTKGLSTSKPILCVHISHIYCIPDSSVKVIYCTLNYWGNMEGMDGRMFSSVNKRQANMILGQFLFCCVKFYTRLLLTLLVAPKQDLCSPQLHIICHSICVARETVVLQFIYF